jgi:hypothetical protein
MDAQQINEWGYVTSRSVVTDTEGRRYVVDNQHGWVVLAPLAGGEALQFDSMDMIDHARYSIKLPEQTRSARR